MVVPRPLLQYSRESVESQRNHWRRDKWLPLFADGHRSLYDALVAHDEEAGGIARSFIHSWVSDGADDPVGLFLLAMVWGWGKDNRGPSNTRRMLEQEGSTDRLGEIVGATRRDGAAAGWCALIDTHAIERLGASFGTKLLYFAGYTTQHRPRPLILDDRVRWSLYDLARGTAPPPGREVSKNQYTRYLALAETWADDPAWDQDPDVVEFGCYDLNGVYDVEVCIPPQR
jgi:hypothetical protein